MSTYVKQGRPATDPVERFWARIDKSSECWRFMGARDKSGRGMVSWYGSTTSASLVAWKLSRKHAPKSVLRNTCGDSTCCNPDHWRDSYRHPAPKLTPEQRFAKRLPRKVRKVLHVPHLGPCWEWSAYIDPNGYGKSTFRGRSDYVHRMAYTVFKGEIPDGTEIDHVCRVRACCNPEHLEAVTHRVNLERSPLHIMFNEEFRHLAGGKKQSHCKNGHELTPENRGASGRCKACACAYVAATHARKKDDPAYRERTQAQRRRRYEANKTDPSFLERERERNRRYYERMSQDPAFVERERERWQARKNKTNEVG